VRRYATVFVLTLLVGAGNAAGAATPSDAATPGAAPPAGLPGAAALRALGGHWHCSVDGAPPAERYYDVDAPAAPAPVVLGREDTSTASGDPIVDVEKLDFVGDRIRLRSAQGSAYAAPAAGVLRFEGTSAAGAYAVTYRIAGDTMQRVMSFGASNVDSERCTRVPEPPLVANCAATPDAPATTLWAAPPRLPAASPALSGMVVVLVSVDERSRAMAARVVRSPNHALDEVAVESTLRSKFRAAVVNCRPVAGEYIFTVSYVKR
jgi:hypothetical protein